MQYDPSKHDTVRVTSPENVAYHLNFVFHLDLFKKAQLKVLDKAVIVIYLE